MSAPQPQLALPSGARSERRIALIQPQTVDDERAAHAIQLFDSILWVFKETTRWTTSAPEAASVIVVHHAEQARAERWRRQGKRIVILSTDETVQPAAPLTLVYPFPAVQVLSVLEGLDAGIDSGNAVATIGAERRDSGGDAWSFVESLRTVRTVGNAALWLVARNDNGPLLWLSGDGRRYCCDAAVAGAIRSGTLDLSGLTLQKGTAPRPGLTSFAGAELMWFAAYHASTARAPWWNERDAHLLIRWPDFGRVRSLDADALAAQIRIVAELDAAPSMYADLATRTNAPPERIVRTLNALACSGLLAVAFSQAAETSRGKHDTPVTGRGLKQFLRNMRKRLRLGAAA